MCPRHEPVKAFDNILWGPGVEKALELAHQLSQEEAGSIEVVEEALPRLRLHGGPTGSSTRSSGRCQLEPAAAPLLRSSPRQAAMERFNERVRMLQEMGFEPSMAREAVARHFWSLNEAE